MTAGRPVKEGFYITPRELEFIQDIVKGFHQTEIAQKNQIHETTVRKTIGHLYTRIQNEFGIENVNEIIAITLLARLNYISFDDALTHNRDEQ